MTRARSLSLLANANAFTVSGSNNVGIGSTLPDVKLDVDGNMNVSGTLTYEDVTNVETAGITTTGGLIVTGLGATIGGITTFFGDLNFGAAGVGGTITTLGHGGFTGIVTALGFQATGVVTAASFRGDGSQLSGVDSSNLVDSGDTNRVAANTSGIVVTGIATVTSDIKVTSSSTNAIVNLKGSGSTNGGQLQVNGANLLVRNRDNGNLQLWANDSERLRISSDGNLRHLCSGGETIFEMQRTDSNTTGAVGTINFLASDDHSVASIGAMGDGDNEGAHIVFRTTSAAANESPYNAATPERLRIDSSGNVGINSTNPAYLLDIASGSASMRLNSTSTSTLVITSGASNAARIEFGDLANNDTGYIYYDNTDDSMQFATNGSNERLRIDSSGNVIIKNSTSGGLYLKAIDGNGDEKILIGYESGTIVRIAESLRMDFGTTSLEPVTDNSVDLGQADKRWKNIYSADLQLSNEGSSNDVDGTWGQYTIQEGENDLFLLNRRNGKKYRFMLEEV